MNDKIKAHLKKYQVHYTIAGVAVVGTALYFLGIKQGSKMEVSIAPVFNNTNIPTANNSVNFGGYARKLIQNIETGQIWGSLKEAAESAGVTESMMSRHVNGHRDHISDMHYQIIGIGTD